MPAVGIVIGDGNREYPGKLTLYVTMTCIVAAMGGLIFGYDIGISGNIFLHIFFRQDVYFCFFFNVTILFMIFVIFLQVG